MTDVPRERISFHFFAFSSSSPFCQLRFLWPTSHTMFSTRIRRNRDRLACLECRRRKLRCDRDLPCGSCVRRGDAPSCSYQAATSGLEHERELRIQAEELLTLLEHLVNQLAARNEHGSTAKNVPVVLASSWRTAGGPVDRGQGTGTQVDGDSEDLSYIGASHWSAMLDDIQALRSAVSPNDAEDLTAETMWNGQEPNCIAMLFGTQAAPFMSIDKVLQLHLPSREEADRLVSSYFWRTAVAAPFIHAQQFRRQYQDFWTSPSSTPVLWTSILFSIFHVSRNALRTSPASAGVDNGFSVAAAQCLVLGEYFRPRRFAVAALLICVQSHCLTSFGVSPEIGSLSSVLIRLATTMGYHRDPETHKFSPFEKEMRRRTWSICMQLDLLISFHLGLPSSIQYSTWDTLPPSTLRDSEFDEDTVRLPTPMPRNELSGMPFYLAKHHLMVVFEKILRHVLTVRPAIVVDGELVALDTELRQVRATLPKILERRPMTECLVEPPELIVTRLCVTFLYSKCICVLHRPYVTRGRAESVTACYAAASAIVQDFVDAQKECKSGGVLEGERWFMTSITWHDFLLGVTSLCMVVCATSQGFASPWANGSAMMELLERARLACLAREGGMNKDTARVVSVISATIRQFGVQFAGGTEDQANIVGSEAVGTHTQLDGPGTTTQMDWPWTEDVTATFDDPNWTYLDRVLDLPGYDA
ncbi:hypothetical protein GE09DRAFT_149431 [Coniochaeta sp. 2T2.1]|nr:hypothetical protein GE09DRAFT_149431 [Coniochaeta sp. 2T2.1]